MTVFVQKFRVRQTTTVATGDATNGKRIKTMAPAAYLAPEFEEFYYNIQAEETFEASQPSKPIVQRDQEAEMDKIRRSNHCMGEFLSS